MDEPDWARILQYLHQHNGEIRRSADEDKASHAEHEKLLYNTVREEINLSKNTNDHLIETHKHLQNNDLIRFKHREEFAAFQLTPKGFDVAHERELNEQNSKINWSIAAFTLVLVIISGVDVVPVWEIRAIVTAMLFIALVVAAEQTIFSNVEVPSPLKIWK